MGYAAPMSEDGFGVLKEKTKICLRTDCQRVSMKIASNENDILWRLSIPQGQGLRNAL